MSLSDKYRIAVAEAQGWSGPWRFGSQHLHGTNPKGEKDSHAPEKVDEIAKELGYTLDSLIAGIEAVRTLMNESQGVAGLHLNGDIATWEELEAFGRFEEWLQQFSYAEEAAEQIKGHNGD